MSPRGRLAVALTALAFLLLVKAQQPGSLLASGARPEAWPVEVVVTASPTPNVYADHPEVRVLQLLTSMNAMWRRAFADAGGTYRLPEVETRAQERGEGCGGSVGGWAGIYCPRGRRIVIDMGDHEVRRAAMGDEGSDDLLGYVLAHEIGHHVQTLRGFVAAGGPDRVLRAELHAQCLAGVWGRAAGRALPPVGSYAPDAEHGTVEEQARWLETGHRTGRPAACDAVWDA